MRLIYKENSIRFMYYPADSTHILIENIDALTTRALLCLFFTHALT